MIPTTVIKEGLKIAFKIVLKETAKELANAEKKNQIEGLKAELSKTDYKCLKFVDGALTEEEYAEVRTYRQSLRDQINQLESELE